MLDIDKCVEYSRFNKCQKCENNYYLVDPVTEETENSCGPIGEELNCLSISGIKCVLCKQTYSLSVEGTCGLSIDLYEELCKKHNNDGTILSTDF